MIAFPLQKLLVELKDGFPVTRVVSSGNGSETINLLWIGKTLGSALRDLLTMMAGSDLVPKMSNFISNQA
jgi:hypothetical protein